MRVFLDRRAAARRVHHDRFHTVFDIRPPRVDVGAQVVERLVVVAQVQTDRAATAGFGRDQRFHAERVEHARRRDVDVRHHRRLHAAREHQHLARMFRGRPFERTLPRGHLVAQFFGQQRADMLPDTHGRREQRAVRHEAREQPAHHPLTERARDFFLGDLAADLDQPAVLHAGWAGGFAVAAGKAAVEMDLGAARDRARLPPSA